MSDWFFGVLGPVEVVRRGVPCKVPAGRQRAVLATLALRVDEVVSASLLLDQIWDGGADRSVLNVCMMRLRRSLQDPDHAILRSEGDGYRLSVDAGDIDLHRFHRLTRDAASAADRGDDEQERRLLHEALTLWRGDPFDGIESATIQSELVPILVEERLTMVERRIDADLRHGLHRELVPELRELVGAHRYRERYWGQLMLSLCRSGRQSDALAAFRTVREILANELGIEPGVELRALQQRVLEDDPELLQPPHESRTEHHDPGYVPLVPAQLPPLASGFTGRGDELGRLNDLLEDATGSRVVAITGLPGVGKTSLGLRWAKDRIADFPDGQLYVDLRGHSSRSPVCPIEGLASFLRAMGVASDEIPADPDAVASMYRSVMAQRRMLVMLDNAADAQQVRPLLPGGSDCLAIVTSRGQLAGLVAQDGAHELVVDTLSDGEAMRLLGKLFGRERLDADPEAGVALAQACGNLPLALRVAGANIASRPERRVADHVAALQRDDRLDVLAVAGDEQLAVRSAFRTSYANLPASARTMFCLLGLFPGREITEDTATVLMDCTPQEASRSLDTLRTAHLIHPLPDGRFVFHDLLRLFAGELAASELTPEQRGAATGRLYVYYATAVELAAQRLYPQSARLLPPPEDPILAPALSDDTRAMSWLGSEQPNLMAAVVSAEANDQPLNGCRIASALRGYLVMRMDLVNWSIAGRASLAAAHAAGDLCAEASARLSLGDLHQYRSEFPAAATHYERTLALCRHIGWVDGEAATHNNLGIALQDQGHLRQAAEHLRHAHELNRGSGWIAGEAMNLTNLGGIELEMGHTSRAAADLRHAHRLHRQAESRQGEAHSLSALGEVLAAMGEYRRARETLQQALAIQETLNDRTQLPLTLGYLANVQLRMGDRERARQLASQALERAAEDGQDATIAAIRVLAAVDHASGRYDDALEGYRRALRLARTTHRLRHAHTATLIDIVRVHLDLGRRGAARHHADRAVAMSRRAGFEGLLTEAEALRSDASSA